MVAEFDRRRKFVVAGLNRLPGTSCATPKGAFYAFPNIRRTGWAAKTLASALLEDLDERGLLESTLVVMVGEFGRSPKIGAPTTNNVGPGGRDHWPSCYTCLLAGGGVRGGQVYGASDKTGAFVRDLPVSPEDFGATLFQALDVDPATRLGADGLSHPASTGQPIHIFG